ncbi:hypothetical protein [Bizionia myxarmorum]|uniref:DUF4738 domain-containing protein n=1 Tax=Bizionia myxarmorum TaxID=291186 RepID=A0A5D0QVE6_9FLAO|nr:hypothetical protein [Bizionia myxarmorum]TYB73167.1 hypothetical protein ES674_15065 [Bizionia myxarmorum]
MKYTSLIILLVFAITFAACDGRDRLEKTPQEILKETKLLDSFSTKTVFIPQTYTEIKTDTILNNGFRIKIKTYSDLENNLVDSIKIDSITTKTFYREFISEVTVFKDEKEIFNKTVDKSFFNTENESLNEDLKMMTLLSVAVENSPDLALKELEEAQISFYYNHIKGDYKLQYTLRIKPNGKFIVSNFEN